MKLLCRLFGHHLARRHAECAWCDREAFCVRCRTWYAR